MSEKTKFAVYLTQKEKEELENRYSEDGSKSQTEFVQRAMRFYFDFLSAEKSSDYLPVAIKSTIEGRLAMFEDRFSSILFKLAVSNETVLHILNEQLDLSEEYLRNIRGDIIRDLKNINGRI